MPVKKVVVKQDAEKPVPVEVMAEAIIAISTGIKKLLAGPLNERCLLLLIQNAAPSIKGRFDSAPITQKQIKAVLEGIGQLEREYLKAKKP